MTENGVPNDEHTTVLSLAEQREFRYVVESARSMGWIGAEDEMDAVRADCSVLVRSHNRRCRRERSYGYGSRWLYELLCDLAHGAWK
ncbi:MAG TPA: hypothetical protein VHK24_00440 [Steroidobacter sp.]|jgi:hypothetical protein|nr:hypothetical protein [Steroidobacter sp.]